MSNVPIVSKKRAGSKKSQSQSAGSPFPVDILPGLFHEINTCEDQDSRQDFLPGKGVLADHDGNERGDDRLHVVVHADCCRADSLQRHRDEQVGEERRPEEDVEDRAQFREVPNLPVESGSVEHMPEGEGDQRQCREEEHPFHHRDR